LSPVFPECRPVEKIIINLIDDFHGKGKSRFSDPTCTKIAFPRYVLGKHHGSSVMSPGKSTRPVTAETTHGIHQQAVTSLFEVFESLCEGAVAVDHEARIVWARRRWPTAAPCPSTSCTMA